MSGTVYRPSVTELERFYHSTLGETVNQRLSGRLKALWPELYEAGAHTPEYLLGMGFTTPYFSAAARDKCHILHMMPAAQGALHDDAVLLSEENELPFTDCAVNAIVMIHLLEYSLDPEAVLREAWRVLAPGGRMILVVPNRLSIWAQVESTPFGHGQPYTPRQLHLLLKEADFTPHRMQMALSMPPTQSRFWLRLSNLWRKMMRFSFNPLGGVLILEVEKEVFAHARESTSRKEKRLETPLPNWQPTG